MSRQLFQRGCSNLRIAACKFQLGISAVLALMQRAALHEKGISIEKLYHMQSMAAEKLLVKHMFSQSDTPNQPSGEFLKSVQRVSPAAFVPATRCFCRRPWPVARVVHSIGQRMDESALPGP